MNKKNPDVLICEGDFDLATEYQALCQRASKSGAVVMFVGLVRDMYEDTEEQDTIDYIELSHYAGMTEKLCQEIAGQALSLNDCEAVRIVHRIGKLYAGEQIVLVAVAGMHRDQAFAAAQYIMDYLKTRATIWKKEVGTRGQEWIGLKQKDANAAKLWQLNKS